MDIAKLAAEADAKAAAKAQKQRELEAAAARAKSTKDIQLMLASRDVYAWRTHMLEGNKGAVSATNMPATEENGGASRLEWRTWPADRVAVVEDGQVCVQTEEDGYSLGWSLVTVGEQATEGRHYWEVELTMVGEDANGLDPTLGVYVGVCRAELDAEFPQRHDIQSYASFSSNAAWLISASFGALYGNEKEDDDEAGEFEQGDRIGVLLDIDRGSLRFFKNGAEHGPGFRDGSVPGGVILAVQMYYARSAVKLIADPEWPAGERR